MVNVIGVRFRTAGRLYYFDPDNHKVNLGDNVIVETARGTEFGTVMMEETAVKEEEIVAPLKKIIRIANKQDCIQHEENIKKKENALALCQEKVDRHGLVMKLIDVEYTFDKTKIIFYFTADGRVDFRDLVKDLAAVFKMRIELRQIGVRDEAKMLGGIGSCGRSLCCHSWLADFEPVSIKMAKVQNLSLNPTKISGVCGRLMCCLKYENDIYMQLRKGMPDVGEKVKTPDGMAKVVETNLIEGKVKVRLFVDDNKNDGNQKGKVKETQEDNVEEKLSSDIYTYKKEEIRRTDRKKSHKDKGDIYEGVDEETMKEIEKLIDD